MCLIVYKSDFKQHFSNKNFKAMISRNDDGLGIMYREDGRVKVEKSVGNAEEKFQLFRRHRDKAHWAMHARYKTHGAVDEKNCHPYKILSIDDGDPIDLYMMHNGILNNAPSVDKEMSDTWHYIEYLIKPIAKTDINLLWENDHIQTMFQDHIGKGNKFLFMRSDDVPYPVLILNHASGVERNGMWLSNTYSIDQTYNYGGSWANRQHNTNYANHNNVTKKDITTHNIPTAQELARQRLANELSTEDVKDVVSQAEKDVLIADRKSAIIPLTQNKGAQSLLLPGLDNAITVETNDDGLLEQLMHLRGLSDHSIKEFIKEDPTNIADIILNLYTKNTMNFETITSLCASKPEDIVNLLRQMAIEHNNKKKSA